jgi:hypothetical protein
VLQEEKQAKVLLAFQFCQTKGRTGKEKEPEKELFRSFLTADKQTNSCHLFDSCHALIGLIFRVMAKRKTLGCQIDSPLFFTTILIIIGAVCFVLGFRNYVV